MPLAPASPVVAPDRARLEPEVQPVAQHAVTLPTDVLGQHVAAPLQQGERPRGLLQRDRSARAGTELDVAGQLGVDHVSEVARRLGDGDGVALDRLVDVHPGGEPDQVSHLGDRHHAGGLRGARAEHPRVDAVEHLQLLVGARIVDHLLQQEAVDLGPRQHVGALVLDRVLRGEHHERRRHRVHHPADRRLALLHRLEQRALGLGVGTVDLVEEHEVGVDRSETCRERGGRGVVDLGADDVARQQVGGALDARERGVDRAGEGGGGGRLGESGQALEQDVALGEQRDEQARAQAFVTDQAFVVARGDAVEDLPRRRQLLVGDLSAVPGRVLGGDHGDCSGAAPPRPIRAALAGARGVAMSSLRSLMAPACTLGGRSVDRGPAERLARDHRCRSQCMSEAGADGRGRCGAGRVPLTLNTAVSAPVTLALHGVRVPGLPAVAATRTLPRIRTHGERS